MDVLCFILLLLLDYCALPAAEGLEESSVNVIPLSVVTENSQNPVSYSYPSLMCSVEDEVTCTPDQFCKDGHWVCGVSPYYIIVCHMVLTPSSSSITVLHSMRTKT